MKIFPIILICYLGPILAAKCQIPETTKTIPVRELHHENDSIVWQTVSSFSTLFNSADTNAMKRFLPDDFLLQWMHENFIGKKGIMGAMRDSAARGVLSFRIKNDNSKKIKYSDDQSAVSVDAAFEFTDPVEIHSMEKENSYGLCIFYLKRDKDRWILKTVHLDIHCALCSL